MKKSAMYIIVPGYGRQQIVFVESGHKAKRNACPYFWISFYSLYHFIFEVSASVQSVLLPSINYSDQIGTPFVSVSVPVWIGRDVSQ